MRKIIAIAAVVVISVLSAAVPIAWAGSGSFAPEPPRPTPIVRCAAGVEPVQAVLVRHGHTYRLYPVKALGLLTPAERGRAVPCVFVTPVRVIR